MKTSSFQIFILNCFLLIFSFSTGLFAQDQIDSLLISQKDSLIVRTDSENRTDTLTPSFVPTLDEFIKKGKRFTLQSNEIKRELENTLDTVLLDSEILEIEKILQAFQERKNIVNTNYNFRFVNALGGILDNSMAKSLSFEKQFRKN
ncbi:hypothetical protein DFQ04_2528 [Algoriphagus boseongensis]|uniref:Uncharacterized protein n=1 Tax=Algoriphagus boseongensis TaxID=1442587 RepID=A0A4R6T6X8_9BACT|nr:hypothetical protein [Algoriphagus boseongensis]TDQ16410.1 hypothetical protein DFQ04_2528 [Algoriphagus boseongensis]